MNVIKIYIKIRFKYNLFYINKVELWIIKVDNNIKAGKLIFTIN